MTHTQATLLSIDYKIEARIRQHTIILDEPVSNGGQDSGPSPTECVSIALASCTTATLKMYANRKQWTLTSLQVEVTHESTPDKKNLFKRKIFVSGQLDEEQKSRLIQIANACPVHKILEGTNIIETALSS